MLFAAWNYFMLGPSWETQFSRASLQIEKTGKSFAEGYLACIMGLFYIGALIFEASKRCCRRDRLSCIAASNAFSIFLGFGLHISASGVMESLFNMFNMLGSTSKLGWSWGLYPILTILLAGGETYNALDNASQISTLNRCSKYDPSKIAPEMKLVAYAFWISCALGDFFAGLLGALRCSAVARAGIITACWCIVGIALQLLTKFGPTEVAEETGAEISFELSSRENGRKDIDIEDGVTVAACLREPLTRTAGSTN